jgi:hypothetical protein
MDYATTSADFASHHICIVDDAENVPIHVYGTSDVSKIGNYYSPYSSVSSSRASGGGAPSLMAHGNSGNIGTGGYGGFQRDVHTKDPPQSGGSNALYISYMPVD